MGGLPAYEPMMAQLGALPSEGDEYGFEMKWDGVRALAYVEDGRVRFVSRNGKDVTVAYPELGGLGKALQGRSLVLDGEIVAFDETGRPSFERLQPRMHQRNPARILELVRAVPVSYLVFDLLHHEDGPVVGLPYETRRELLSAAVSRGERWDVPPFFVGDGAEVLGQSRRLALEGIVAKRLASPYRPGKRTAEWVKVKNYRAQEVVIGGWQPGEGRRAGSIGSLLLGVYDGSGLRYAGHVGTGFSEAALRELAERLAPLERETSPFADEVPREHARAARWVEPELVGEVQYAEWTADGRLRHPSWRGLRSDKAPEQVHRETAA
ncbi:non-homologous end-joining DNA ligase [Bailinhaonella thermotolerans]|uniref:DNA ligase (ATP) n=1 Tax=Bailinhaonella thermotolerans TaxID=1070861 RepID=A0A3A4BFE0_9ACTN|nr:non-homologous end-joining DNA ligase [Bailinhaonella thermotolerans]RJL33192.1 hypothetical protein D5H75_10135 [Bailinhaonella thermotolerans]